MTNKNFLFNIFPLFLVIFQSEANEGNMILLTENRTDTVQSSRQTSDSSSGEKSFYFREKIYQMNLNEETFDDSWWACESRNGLFVDENDSDELNAVADHVISLYSETPDICNKYWIGPCFHKRQIDVNQPVGNYFISITVDASGLSEDKYDVTMTSGSNKFCSVCVVS